MKVISLGWPLLTLQVQVDYHLIDFFLGEDPLNEIIGAPYSF